LSQEVSFVSAGWKRLSTRDRVIVGGAGVAFIAGFLPWWAGLGLGGWSRSGWSAGFTAWAGTLLLTAAGVLVVLRRSGVSWPMTVVGPSKLIAGVSVIGLLLVFIRWLTLPRHHATGFVQEPRHGIYVALIAGVVEVAAAVSEVFDLGSRSWPHSQSADAKPQGLRPLAWASVPE
jgi:hypothetical protein